MEPRNSSPQASELNKSCYGKANNLGTDEALKIKSTKPGCTLTILLFSILTVP